LLALEPPLLLASRALMLALAPGRSSAELGSRCEDLPWPKLEGWPGRRLGDEMERRSEEN
tara:strand:- start:864 stop:1043 length:180 start_codon:yes stop_codon:yes gene_type:complete